MTSSLDPMSGHANYWARISVSCARWGRVRPSGKTNLIFLILIKKQKTETSRATGGLFSHSLRPLGSHAFPGAGPPGGPQLEGVGLPVPESRWLQGPGTSPALGRLWNKTASPSLWARLLHKDAGWQVPIADQGKAWSHAPVQRPHPGSTCSLLCTPPPDMMRA